jgi:NADH dehydrogenase (ubiquinone) 1 beta subcomplex subunit 8
LRICDKVLTTKLIHSQNGGYQNPPAEKRQFRDPYGDWWDKQERRNYGEPVHEDNDVLGIFSLEEYTHMTPARGFLLWGGFISVVLGLSALVHTYYPDRPSTPKEYADGLEPELGGKGSVRVRLPHVGKYLEISIFRTDLYQAWKTGDTL